MDMDVTAQVLKLAQNNHLMSATTATYDEEDLVKQAQQLWQGMAGHEALLLENYCALSPDLQVLYEQQQQLSEDKLGTAVEALEELAFKYEISTVMSLHSVLATAPKEAATKAKVTHSAALTYSLKKVLPWPSPLSKAICHLCTLAMYATISKQEHDFNDYLTAFLPYLAILQHDRKLALQAEQAPKAAAMSTTSKSCACVDTEDDDAMSNSLDALLKSRYELTLSQELLLLELCLLLQPLFAAQAELILDRLDKFKEHLLQESERLNNESSMEHKKRAALYLLYLSKVTAAFKVYALYVQEQVLEPNQAQDTNTPKKAQGCFEIEQPLNVAQKLSSKVGLSDLEIIARALKLCLVLRLRNV